MHTFIRNRQTMRCLLALSVVAVLALGVLEVYRFLHNMDEFDCVGCSSDNPAACPLCSHYSLLMGMVVENDLVPRPNFIGLRAPAAETVRDSVWRPVHYPGRSPPLSS